MAPALVSIVLRIMYQYTQTTKELAQWNFTNEAQQVCLNSLVLDQCKIGWDNFFKGHMANEWSSIQGQHYCLLIVRYIKQEHGGQHN